MKLATAVLAFTALTTVVAGVSTEYDAQNAGVVIATSPSENDGGVYEGAGNVAVPILASFAASFLGPVSGGIEETLQRAPGPNTNVATNREPPLGLRVPTHAAQAHDSAYIISSSRPSRREQPISDASQIGLYMKPDDTPYRVGLVSDGPDHTFSMVVIILVISGTLFVMAYLHLAGLAKLKRYNEGKMVAEHEGDEFEPCEVVLDHDVYGAGIYSIIHDGWDIVTNVDHDDQWMSSNKYHLVFVLTILFLNYVLQLSVLMFTHRHVVQPGIDKVQAYYADFVSQCYTTDGRFNQTAWAVYDAQEEVCSIVFTYFWFVYVILILWVGVMMKEGRHTDRLYRNLRDIPSIQSYDDDMYLNDPETGISRVVALGPILRSLLYTFVIVPKLIINVVLLALGMQWLTSTVRFTNLVLNSVSLGFIVKIDELLYEALMPASTHRGIENFRLAPLLAKDRNADTVWSYMRSTIYFVFMCLLPYAWLTVGQAIPYVNILQDFDRTSISQICRAEILSGATG